MHTTEAIRLLEQQFSEIVDIMDDVDRVSGAVDNDFDKINTDSIKMPYNNVNDINTCTTKYE